MTDLACFSCHRINGHGGDMAPDLTWEGSSVQREWLVQFFKNPGTLRPSLIRRMPRFNLTDGEVNELTDYIMTVYQSPAVDRDSMPLSGYSQGEVELGQAAVLWQVFVPGMPHRGHEDRQGLHRSDFDPCWIAADGSMDLSVDEESAVLAPGNGRTEPCHERRRCARAHSVSDVAKRRGEILRLIQDSKGQDPHSGGRKTMKIRIAFLLGWPCSEHRAHAKAPRRLH